MHIQKQTYKTCKYWKKLSFFVRRWLALLEQKKGVRGSEIKERTEIRGEKKIALSKSYVRYVKFSKSY